MENTDSSELDEILLTVAQNKGWGTIEAKEAILSRYRSIEDIKEAVSKQLHEETCYAAPASDEDSEAPGYFGPGKCDCYRHEILAALKIGDSTRETK